MRNSQARRLVPGVKRLPAARARTMVSWARSAASSWSCVREYANLTSRGWKAAISPLRPSLACSLSVIAGSGLVDPRLGPEGRPGEPEVVAVHHRLQPAARKRTGCRLAQQVPVAAGLAV